MNIHTAFLTLHVINNVGHHEDNRHFHRVMSDNIIRLDYPLFENLRFRQISSQNIISTKIIYNFPLIILANLQRKFWTEILPPGLQEVVSLLSKCSKNKVYTECSHCNYELAFRLNSLQILGRRYSFVFAQIDYAHSEMYRVSRKVIPVVISTVRANFNEILHNC